MSSIYGKKMMSLIRAADIAPKKKGYGKHHNSDNSSDVARKRRIQTELMRKDRGKTVFGDTPTGYGVFSKRGSGNTLIDKTTQANKRTTNKGANKGTQGDYIYFKKIIPSQGKIPTK
jgi:hypothetical protein